MSASLEEGSQAQSSVDALWQRATSFEDLLSLNRRFLVGDLRSTIYHLGPVDEETLPLLPHLLDLHRCSVLTLGSQPSLRIAYEAGTSAPHLPSLLEQRFYLEGICPAALRSRLSSLTSYFVCFRTLDTSRYTLLCPPDCPVPSRLTRARGTPDQPPLVLPCLDLTRVVLPDGSVRVETACVFEDGVPASAQFLADLPNLRRLLARDHLEFIIIARSFVSGSLADVLLALS